VLPVGVFRRLAARYRRSPDQLSEEEVRGYLLGLRERGVALGTFKAYHGGIQFLYRRTLDRDWALFQKKEFGRPSNYVFPSSRGPVGPASPLSSGLREEPGSQGLLRAHVRLRLAHKRGRDLGNRRHRQRQSAASHHRQGRQRAARAVATTGSGWPAGALEDPP
jgi:Phage integrase, N-terminal SAM-like domain